MNGWPQLFADVTLLQIKFMPRQVLSEVLHEKQWTCILRIGRSFIIANQFHAMEIPFLKFHMGTN